MLMYMQKEGLVAHMVGHLMAALALAFALR